MSSRLEVDNLSSACYIQDDTDLTKRINFNVTNVTGDKTITFVDSNITVVGEANTTTLTNKTIDANNNTISNIADTNIAAAAAIDASKIANGTISNTEFEHLNGVTSSVVGIDDTQTLTNKTLTDPQVGTSILDTNGNELINVTATVSAVNEVTVANAATGTAPTISASGDDTNIDLNIDPKGTGQIVLDGLKWPATDGTMDQILKTDGAGNISFANVDLATISTATTTDATETTLVSVATSSDEACLIDANVVGIRTDSGTEAVGYRFIALFRNNAGTLVKVSEQKTILEDAAAVACDASVSASGTDILVRVTGIAVRTFNWKVSYKTTMVG